MGTRAKLALPLYVGDPAQHAGATFATGMDADELLDGVPSAAARINSVDPLATYFTEQFALPGGGLVADLPAGMVGLVGTNLTQDGPVDSGANLTDEIASGRGARVRFVLNSLGTGPNGAPVRMYPTSESGKTNLSGSYTDVDDDPFNSAATGSMAATNATWEVRYNFGTPARNFIPGAEGQMFVLAMEMTDAVGALTFELYEAGSKVADLVAVRADAVDAQAAQLYVIYWNSSSLSGAGVAPQLRVAGSGALHSEIFGVALYPTIKNAGGVSPDYDSGWIVALPDVSDAAFGDLPASYCGDLPARNVFHWPSADDEIAYYWSVQIRDPFNVDGYIDIGEMVAGARFEATINRDLGKLLDLKPLGSKTITLGGKHVGVAGEFIRSIFMPLSWMTPAEGAALLERVQRMNTLSPVVVSLHDSSASEARLLSCYGSLGIAPEYAAPYALIRGTTIVVDEEL